MAIRNRVDRDLFRVSTLSDDERNRRLTMLVEQVAQTLSDIIAQVDTNTTTLGSITGSTYSGVLYADDTNERTVALKFSNGRLQTATLVPLEP